MKDVKIKAFNFIGIWIRTSNLEGQAEREIGELWQKFMADNTLKLIPNKIDDTIYSLYTEYEGDHLKPYTAVIGCRVKSLDQIPEGMYGQTIKGGNYKEFVAKGDIMKGSVGQEWYKIWEMNLDRSFKADFEVYNEKAKDLNNAEVNILIGIN